MMKQTIVGAGFVGFDFCPSIMEVVLHVLGQFVLDDEPVEIINKALDGVFWSIQIIEKVIMLVFDEMLAHGLGQLQEVHGCIHIVTLVCKGSYPFTFRTYLNIDYGKLP